MSDIIYTFKNNAYFNITNRCTCKCIFCIRNEHEAIGEATELWHDHNPSFEEIKEAIDAFDFTNYPEAVFCGYGEPTCAYDNLIAAAKYMKEKHPEVLLRVNTNGLGELFNKKPIAEEMAKYIDAVSISLNAPTSEQYNEVSRPQLDNAFEGLLQFATECKGQIPSVKLTIVDVLPKEEIEACKKLAASLDIPLRIRKYA